MFFQFQPKSLFQFSIETPNQPIFFQLNMNSWNAYCINLWGQGATNRVRNVQMYANKFFVYAKFLEAVQSFLPHYNILLISFVYFDPAFSIGWIFFVFLSLLTSMPRKYLIVPLIFLQSWSNLLYQRYMKIHSFWPSAPWPIKIKAIFKFCF